MKEQNNSRNAANLYVLTQNEPKKSKERAISRQGRYMRSWTGVVFMSKDNRVSSNLDNLMLLA